MKTRYSQEMMQKKIDDILQKKAFDAELRSRSVEEIVEQVSIYHQELAYQNAELSRLNEELEYAKRRYKGLFNDAPVGYVIYDVNGSIREANSTFCSMVGGIPRLMVEQKFQQFIMPECQDTLYFMNNRVMETGKSESVELKIRGRLGPIDVTVTCNAFAQARDGNPVEEALVRCAIMDVTTLNEMLYVSYHDPMTGLYNRRYYEEKTVELDTAGNLPLSIAVLDVDALKIVNDSLGHDFGDRVIITVADVLKKLARPEYVIIRTGGDEIVILFPRTARKAAQNYLAAAREYIERQQVGGINLSISSGIVTKQKTGGDLAILVAQAEDIMYSGKLLKTADQKNSTVAVVLHRLFEQCPMLKQHSEAVVRHALALGKMLDLPDRELRLLEEIGRLHDIGLVTFLHKKGIETGFAMFSENTEFMRHPQIGCRILRSISGMEKIADAVLFHHESWDGSGYPYGLKGEEIPLLSRIIAIADAYAWTSEDTSPLVTDTACRKQFFEKNSGFKFDPQLMRLFIDKFLSHESAVS